MSQSEKTLPAQDTAPIGSRKLLCAALKFRARGVGLDKVRKCFVCGCNNDLFTPNIAAFVDTKSEGETIVSWFPQDSAWLDFREHEPNWVQVKIGACKEHEPALHELCRLTRSGDIYKRDIHLAQLKSA